VRDARRPRRRHNATAPGRAADARPGRRRPATNRRPPREASPVPASTVRPASCATTTAAATAQATGIPQVRARRGRPTSSPRQWVAELGQSLSAATVRNTFVALNKVCRYAVRHRHIAANPCTGTVLAESVSIRNVLPALSPLTGGRIPSRTTRQAGTRRASSSGSRRIPACARANSRRSASALGAPSSSPSIAAVTPGPEARRSTPSSESPPASTTPRRRSLPWSD